MSALSIPADHELIARLEEIAERQGRSVEELVQDLLQSYVDQTVVSRKNDPIIGLFGSKHPDTASRAEEILENEWIPD